MLHKQDLRKYIIEWNNRYPLDRVYRKKYNIAFGSLEHRSLSMIDICADIMEDDLYEEAITQVEEREERDKNLKKGVWFLEDVTTESEMDLFDKIDIGKFKGLSVTDE